MYKWKLITNFIFFGSLTGLCILFLVYICENYNWALLEKQPPPLTLFTRAILLLFFTRPSKKTGALTNSGWIEASSLTPSLTKALHYSHDLSLNAIPCITSFLWNFNYKKVCLVMWKSPVHKADFLLICSPVLSVGIWLLGHCINMSTSDKFHGLLIYNQSTISGVVQIFYILHKSLSYFIFIPTTSREIMVLITINLTEFIIFPPRPCFIF